MRRNRNLILAWLGTVLVVALCLYPKHGMPVSETHATSIPHLDKLIHFSMFVFLGVLWTRVGRGSAAMRSARVFVAMVLLGIATEVAQGHPLVQRDPDRYDALADAVGAAAGIAVAVTVIPRKLDEDSREA